MSINKVILIGRAGKDPETKYMTSGDAVTNLSLATSEKWKDKSGEPQEKTEWHNLTFYRRLAEVVGDYVVKGSLLYIEGKLSTRKWQDKEGKDRYTTEIIVDKLEMLGGKSSGEPREQRQASNAPAEQLGGDSRGNDGFDDFDCIPF